MGVAATQSSTTRPATLPATWPTTAPFKVQLQLNDVPHPDVSISLFAIGLLVDGDGHAVFPISVDRKYLGDAPLPAVTGDGQATTATFVGCDPKTNLTVLQLKNHTGTPAALGHSRPEDGSLTLVIATDGGARLLVWNGQHPEAGFAVLPDGAVAGFGFNQHFLAAATAKPIVDQLIATGEVHRAILGVLMKAVDRDDALRHQRQALGTSPAIRITAVQEGSAAAQGGLQIDDLILSIDDQPVGDAPTFAAVIATHRGQTTLKVLRGEKAMDVVVNLQPK
jgi:S1-C subfamily serine protease